MHRNKRTTWWRTHHDLSRRSIFESLEDRRMLAAMADVVFLVDNSASDGAITKLWLNQVLSGDANQDGIKDPGELTLSERLGTQGVTDVRYGLVAFGEYSSGGADRFAHSEVVDTDLSKAPFDRLFSSGLTAQAHIDDVTTAISHLILVENGGEEDGWDAIEHAIAEYDFRPGAVPILVLVQNEEGRIDVNKTLTHDGVLAALKSKNVILNSLVVGAFGPLFDMTPYEVTSGDFLNIRMLGIEASVSGNGQHEYHAFDTSTETVPTTLPATQADALQISFDGSNTGSSGMVDSGKSLLIGKTLSGGIGPSAAGYRAKEVPYVWESVTTGGTTVPTGPNGSLAYAFNFYGTAFPRLWVNESGTITFADPAAPTGTTNLDPGGTNVDLSRAVANANGPSRPLIAALWDEMLSSTTVQTRLKNLDNEVGAPNNDLLIQWNARYTGDNTPVDGITFQAVLFSNGSIRLSYQDIDSYPGFAGSPPVADLDSTVIKTGGISATVGIWNGNSSTGDAVNLSAGKFVPGVQSIFGAIVSINGGGETNDSYVRMAWDTGGAAWDVGIAAQGLQSPVANALRDAFIASLAKQINNATTAGKVARIDDVLLAFNLGDGAIAAEGFAADTLPGSAITVSGSTVIDTTSNSIPLTGSGAKFVSVFRSAKLPTQPSPPLPAVNDLTLSFLPSSFPTLVDGRYIVELFFSDIDSIFNSTGRVFDVIVEGETMLNDYSIVNDHTKIVEVAGSPVVELDANEAGRFTGVVKRFAVNIGSQDGTAGLQITLNSNEAKKALINGIRILRADAPRIENVVVKGTSWASGVDYSYAEAVAAGNQLRPIYLQNANQIQVHFDGPVNLSSAQLNILGDNRAIVKTSANSTITFAGYDETSFIATWNLSTSLGLGKYALELTGVKGSGNVGLDGKWTNYDGANAGSNSPDTFVGDKSSSLLSGNGSPGSIFEFWFSVLPGDYDQNGIVNSADAVSGTIKDGDGDGVIENGTGGDDRLIATGSNLGTQLPLRHHDYVDDDIVNGADYALWRATFGSTSDFRADGNGDGEVNAADYVIWRNTLGWFSAWYTASIGTSAAGYVVDFGNAPKVTNVTISGSNSTHDPYSFDAHDGSGEQLRTVPVGSPDTVSITFSEDVNVSAEDLQMVGARTFAVPMLVEFTYDMATMTATWRFDDLVARDQYILSLSDDVTDIEGNRLDGEWVNPASVFTTNSAVSEFPSGDGNAGGTFTFAMTLLAGDADLNNKVNGRDYDIWSLYWAQDGSYLEGDFDGDGIVTGADYDLWQVVNGLNLQSLSLWGDLDGDFDVDTADSSALASHLGMSSPTRADGDLNGDGVIDHVDLDLIFAQFGLNLDVVS